MKKRTTTVSTPAKKPRYASKPISSVPRIPRSLSAKGSTGLPNVMTVAMRRVQNYASWYASAPPTRSISTNSLYTEQPMYYDQLMALYGKYTVMKSVCKIRFGTNGTNLGVAGGFIADVTASTTAPVGYLENPTSKNVWIDNQAPKFVTLYWNRNTRLGGDLSGVTSSGTIIAGPTAEEFFTAWAPSGTDTPVTFDITYDVVWSDPKQVAISA